MALTWDLNQIKDYDDLMVEVEGGRRLDALTEALIWQTMLTGLDPRWELGEKFAPEFFARIKLIEAVHGPLVLQGGKPYEITYDDIHRRIGLQTNASPVSRAQFIKRLVTHEMDSYVKRAERRQKQLRSNAGEVTPA